MNIKNDEIFIFSIFFWNVLLLKKYWKIKARTLCLYKKIFLLYVYMWNVIYSIYGICNFEICQKKKISYEISSVQKSMYDWKNEKVKIS